MIIDEKSFESLKGNFANSEASVMITDKNGIIEFVNVQFEERTGYAANEVIGKYASILKSGDTKTNKYEDLWTTILKGHIWSGEFKNKKKNGEVFWEYSTIYPILNKEKEIIHFLSIREDITPIKQMDEEIKKEEVKRKLYSVMKYNFLNRISHEIRTPLNIMISFTNLFRLYIDSEKANAFTPYLILVEELNNKIIQTIDFVFYISELKPNEDHPKLKFLESSFIDELVNAIKIPAQTILGISLALESKCSFKLENDLKILFKMMLVSCNRVIAIVNIIDSSRNLKDEYKFIHAVTERIDKVKESFQGDANAKIFQLPQSNLPEDFPDSKKLDQRYQVYKDLSNNKAKEEEWLNDLITKRTEDVHEEKPEIQDSYPTHEFDHPESSPNKEKNKHKLVELNKIEGCTVVSVKYTNIDYEITHSLERFIQKEISGRNQKVIFDFSKSQKVKSCMWGLFIRLIKQEKLQPSNIGLVMNYEKQSNTFISSQLDVIFPVFQNLNEALHFFNDQRKIS